MKSVSVIIPAYNEEKYIEKCLASIRSAATHIDIPVEIVVSLNRCTDNTEMLAKKYGAITIVENDKNLAKIRNSGVRSSSGCVVVTIDADSWMSPGMLKAIIKNIRSQEYIGGGVKIKSDRTSAGILCTAIVYKPLQIMSGISFGLYWLLREDFEAINGFDESYVSGEDADFAKRLKIYGKKKKKKFFTITDEYITTSARKFDQFGDWYLIRNPLFTIELFSGRNRAIADKIYYNAER